MKKTIALISEHASPLATLGGVDSGGQNVYVGELAKNLAILGYKVDVFTRCDNKKLPRIVIWSKDVRIIHIPAGPKKYIRKEELLPFMDEFTNNIVEFIEENGVYSIIHANFWMSAYAASNIKKLLGIPFVVTFHALGRVRRLYQKKLDEFPDERFLIEDLVIKEADQIIAECPQDKEDLLSFYHANKDKITVIPSGFNPNDCYPIDKSLAKMTLGFGKNKKIILQLGRMVKRKDMNKKMVVGIVTKREKQKMNNIKSLVVVIIFLLAMSGYVWYVKTHSSNSFELVYSDSTIVLKNMDGKYETR